MFDVFNGGCVINVLFEVMVGIGWEVVVLCVVLNSCWLLECSFDVNVLCVECDSCFVVVYDVGKVFDGLFVWDYVDFFVDGDGVVVE